MPARTCRQCDYDLSATPQVAGLWRCPECGKDHEAGDFEPRPGSMWSMWVLALILAPLMTIIATQAARAVDAFPWAWPLVALPTLAATWCLSMEEAHWNRRRVRPLHVVLNLILLISVSVLVYDAVVLEWGVEIVPPTVIRQFD